ncbi:sensor domain-containing diguanylate cyclase [bacterium]|nr:sensor domain-containing diguanylate cyclase [bacterium]
MTLSAKDFQYIVENITDGVYVTDTNRKMLYCNKGAEHIAGYTAKEVVGHYCFHNILNHVDALGNNLCKSKCPLTAVISTGKTHESEVYLHHKDGHRVPVWVRATPMKDEKDEIIGAVELFSDISSQDMTKLRVQELEKLALIDTLTQISNRRHIESEIFNRIEELKRYKLSFGILFIDIDNFKNFNDTHGHDMGDSILKIVAKTLSTTARPFDLFGRWGGEEFIGIIRNVGKEQLPRVAERMRALVEKSHVKTDKEDLNITISIGATVAKPDDDLDSLVKRADELMYKSKTNGRNKVTSD